MAQAKAAFEANDRVRRRSDGARATVLYFHKDAKRITVLPDDHFRTEGAVVWECSAVERTGVLSMTCPVCGDHHYVFYCPERRERPREDSNLQPSP